MHETIQCLANLAKDPLGAVAIATALTDSLDRVNKVSDYIPSKHRELIMYTILKQLDTAGFQTLNVLQSRLLLLKS